MIYIANLYPFFFAFLISQNNRQIKKKLRFFYWHMLLHAKKNRIYMNLMFNVHTDAIICVIVETYAAHRKSISKYNI